MSANGPWTTDNVDVFTGDGKKVCHLTLSSSDGKLIAAAPELYEALDEAINYLIVWMAAYGSGKNGKADALLSKCTAALAKARGEQP